MTSRPLRLAPSAMFRARELGAIETAAMRILEEVGIEVAHPELTERVRRQGFRLEQERVRLSRRQVESFLAEEGSAPCKHRRRPQPGRTGPVRLTMSVSGYADHMHDPETDEIVRFSTSRVVDSTKLVAMLGDRGLEAGVPGCPVDVPAPLQSVLQYRIGIENLPGGGEPVDAKSLESLPYVMAMAEVLGRPIRSLPVYVGSPLRLGGESLSAAIALEPRLDSICVASYPSAGCTAPVRPAEAFALAAAEVLGSALILRECMKCQVFWEVAVYSSDLRGMSMSYGSPENLLFEMASREVNAYLHRQPWWPDLYNTGSTMAKLPGPQAAAEKMNYMTMAALFGARTLFHAGALSMSEVFSPIQLLLDLEMKDHVERMIRGLDTRCDSEACVQDVRVGLDAGFVGLDRTVDLYREIYWHPRLFERRFLGPWTADPSPRGWSHHAREMVRELVARHNYEPPAEVRAEVERIYQRAERELAGASTPEA